MLDWLHTMLGLLRAGEDDADRLLERRILAAKSVLLFEQVWRALLWPFVLTGCFLFVSILGLWSLTPGWLHGLTLFALAIGLVFLLVPLARVRWPGRDEALRRLERDSGSRHRPASTWDDTLVQTDSPESTALWRLHRERVRKLVNSLKPKFPSPKLAGIDPFALRALVMLLLVSASVAVGAGAWDRIAGAFSFDPTNAAQRYRLHAWVTPPVYTGKPPIVLADGQARKGSDQGEPETRTVPEGSVILVRVHGAATTRPTIVFDETDARKNIRLEAEQAEGQMAEYRLTLAKSGHLSVRDSGRSSIRWSFDVTPDQTPAIRLVEDPTTTPRGALRLVYAVIDDYGVSQAEARFSLPLSAEAKSSGAATLNPQARADPLIKPPVIALRLPSANVTSGEGRTFKDLTSHPWAGQRVSMQLVARDQGGNEGTSDAVQLTLPQREFNKPLARAIIEQRGKLVISRLAREGVAQALEGLTISPEKFQMDKSVYLALRSAYWRLQRRTDDEALISVVDQLWDVAVNIEDGDLSDAERELQAAQDRLMRAIQDGASEQQIAKLVDELRAALNRFMRSLAQNARERGLANFDNKDLENGIVSSRDLDQLLGKIEDLARTGSRDLAQRLLGELRDILERLQMGMRGQDMQRDQMMKAVEGLGEIIAKQQKLMDETFEMRRQRGGRRGEDGRRPGQSGQRPGQREGQSPSNQGRQGMGEGGAGKGPKGGGGSGGLAKRQGELGGQLGRLMEQLEALGAKPPDQLQGAGQAMGDAQRSLDGQALGRATQQQGLALDRLRKGTQSMAEQMMKMMGAQMGRAGQGKRDPLGRPDRTQGPDLGSSVRVPDEIDIQRAREILDELRRRLSEPTRPLLELDYLERLIRSF